MWSIKYRTEKNLPDHDRTGFANPSVTFYRSGKADRIILTIILDICLTKEYKILIQDKAKPAVRQGQKVSGPDSGKPDCLM